MYRCTRNYFDGKRYWKRGETSEVKAHKFMEPTKAGEKPAAEAPDNQGEGKESYADIKKRAYELRDKLVKSGKDESEVEISDKSEEGLLEYIKTHSAEK